MYTSEDTVLLQSSCNFARMFISIKSRPGLKIGHVRLKTRSSGQILKKPSVPSRRHSFDPVFMKLCQKVYLHEIYVKYETRSHWAKTRSPGQLLENRYVPFRGRSFNAIFMQFAKICISIKSKPGPKLGHVRS